MNEFLDLSDKPRLNQKEINDSNKETETVVKKPSNCKPLRPSWIYSRVYTTIREELQLNT